MMNDINVLLNRWIIEERLNNQELGNKVREYYWDLVKELNEGK